MQLTYLIGAIVENAFLWFPRRNVNAVTSWMKLNIICLEVTFVETKPKLIKRKTKVKRWKKMYISKLYYCLSSYENHTVCLLDKKCITEHEEFHSIILLKNNLWTSLVQMHDITSRDLTHRNNVENRWKTFFLLVFI